MAIEIKERFSVDSPIEAVWAFMVDPAQVVTCMPGAELEEVVDDKTFLGSVKIKLGAISTRYQGRVRFSEVNEATHEVHMIGEGRETGGGTAKAAITNRLATLPDGGVEIVIEARIDLTGRIVQVGRGMIQGVAHQIFQQFAQSVKTRLEGAAAPVEGAASGSQAPAASNDLRILPILLQTLAAAISRFVRKLFGRPTPER